MILVIVLEKIKMNVIGLWLKKLIIFLIKKDHVNCNGKIDYKCKTETWNGKFYNE